MLEAQQPYSDELLFAVIAIETAAEMMGISTAELTARLEKHDLIEGLLWKHYDVMHTQSRQYVAEDLITILKRCEEQC